MVPLEENRWFGLCYEMGERIYKMHIMLQMQCVFDMEGWC